MFKLLIFSNYVYELFGKYIYFFIYINFYDNFSGKEFFIFEDSLNSQSNTFTEQWDGQERAFLIANTVDYELILFSDNSYEDFSKNIINDFPVEVILKSDPYTVTIKKYLPKN